MIGPISHFEATIESEFVGSLGIGEGVGVGVGLGGGLVGVAGCVAWGATGLPVMPPPLQLLSASSIDKVSIAPPLCTYQAYGSEESEAKAYESI